MRNDAAHRPEALGTCIHPVGVPGNFSLVAKTSHCPARMRASTGRPSLILQHQFPVRVCCRSSHSMNGPMIAASSLPGAGGAASVGVDTTARIEIARGIFM
jgi:hypothetical protein